MNWSTVRGFNYQPSYGSTSFENWLFFNPGLIELELRRGKEYFPGITMIRVWLSYDAYLRDPAVFLANFETMLRILDRLSLRAMPILFNRWHDPLLDCGGIYVDHFMPKWNWVSRVDRMSDFVRDVVRPHATDARIVAWDLCNEPFSYDLPPAELGAVFENERAWLRGLYRTAKAAGAMQPMGVGMCSVAHMEPLDAVSDVFMIHSYYSFELDNEEEKRKLCEKLDSAVAYAGQRGKPIVVNETCWGSVDDRWRVDNLRFHLGELVKRKLGFLPHALHYSRISDLHGPEDGPVGRPGNLAFTNRDGSLRAGHEAFNEF